jgi:hypothetical protein
MGDDCFRCMAGLAAGAPVCGIWESNCAGIESMGDCSGVCVACAALRFDIPVLQVSDQASLYCPGAWGQERKSECLPEH